MRGYLVFTTILQFVYSSCPVGMDLISDGQCIESTGDRIKLSRSGALQKALTNCKEENSYPIIIKSQSQQDYWLSQLDKVDEEDYSHNNGSYTSGVLGLVCNKKTRKWEWADGSAMLYIPDDYEYLDDPCDTRGTWYIDYDHRYGSVYWSYATSSYSEIVYIYCTYQLPEPVPPPSGCDNFDDDTDDGVCYQVHENTQTWQDGELTCKNFGADLASIHNQKENSFIRRLAVSTGAVNGVYLGGTVTGKGNNFGWIDGSAWDYDNYYPGFPVPGIGDCLAMDTLSTSGEWMNMDCSTKLAVACVRKEDPKPFCPPGPWIEGQMITSPGYPYDASTPCDYFLSVEAGKRVQVEIQLLEANSCCDRLVMTDNLLGGNVVANITGAIDSGNYTTMASNFMRVSWQPTGGINVRGMMITYRGV